MEQGAPIQAQSPDVASPEGQSQSDNWVWIAVGVLALYLIFNKRKKSKDKEDEDAITSYESFASTNLGKSLTGQMQKSYIELTEAQKKDLDECFGGLTKTEKKVFKKACRYSSKEAMAKNMSRGEIAIFKPLRQRIINCFREQKINIE